MTNKSIIAVIIVCLTVIFSIAMMVGNSPQEIPTPQVKETVPQETETFSYEYEFLKDVFIEMCVEDDSFEYCSCTWDYLEGAYGKEGLVDVIQNYDGGLSKEMEEAINYCLIKTI